MRGLLTILLALIMPSLAMADNVDYTLGSGDLVHIVVFGEPDLSDDFLVGPSGNIGFPLLGDVSAAGSTPSQLQQEISTLLRNGYLIDPRVSISIKEYRLIYINGEVESPGDYSFTPGLTIEKAIAIAGGFTDRASRQKIFVTHDVTSASKDSSKLLSGKGREKLSLSDFVRPGDVITVEQSFF
ncbi:polysaccharide biosynthesis/export family protein [Oceanobacter antarcticus]|uniref:Polysaccharide biosynthesis/export family protein n=1 Tax=Oceanobacter antarcticus TaxID=3133425 RepID=A0ABW8NI65_9GAMM|tara:strand:- start:250 stop:801 length:552 start_codon:yes stop_codon:yes gene_type:complete